MNVIFVEPAFPANQREFTRALHQAGAKVIGIGERPEQYLDNELKSWLSAYFQIGAVTDGEAMLKIVRHVQKNIWVDRLEATVEAHIQTAAYVREACGIPGTSVRTAHLCRDKVAMKEVLRQAGIPCAQSTGADSLDAGLQFARQVGYPLIVKPRAGAGAADTARVENDAELRRALVQAGINKGHSVAIEEFLEGHEGFIDTITIDGQVAQEFITHYYPGVLEAMRTRWISPQMVTTNRMDAPGYNEVKQMNRKVIRALGIGSSATHMEWFAGPNGLKFSEIGCRPPGVCQWDVYCAANELDLYREWAMAVCFRHSEKKASRNFAGGMIAIRPDRDGRIAGYSGVEELNRRYGKWIVKAHLPPVGTPTQPVDAGYMANAWIRARHPDYDGLREILNDIGQTLKVYAH